MKDSARTLSVAMTTIFAPRPRLRERGLRLEGAGAGRTLRRLGHRGSGRSLDVATTPLSALPANENARVGWERFRATHGPEWRIHLDRRSGAPSSPREGDPVGGRRRATVESIAASLRPFIARNRALLVADNAEMVLDTDGSAIANP